MTQSSDERSPSRFPNRVARAAAVAGLAAIVVLSLLPGAWRPVTGLPKEAEHAGVYFLVAVGVALTSGLRWPFAAGLCLASALLELAQRMVPGRHADFGDFAASSLGAILGYAAATLVSAIAPAVLGSLMRRSLPVPLGQDAWRAAYWLLPGAAAVAASLILLEAPAGYWGAALAILMAAVAAIDAKFFLIPDELNFLTALVGMARLALSVEPVWALTESAIRLGLCAAALLAIRTGYRKLRGHQGLGMGDVKLAAAAAIWLDWEALPLAIEIAALVALGVLRLQRLVSGRAWIATQRIPFGLYFAPAIWASWLAQELIRQL